MRTVIQRVKKAGITVNDKIISAINEGLLIFVGIEDDDDISDVEWLAKKIVHLRIFDDEKNVPNISVKDKNGDLLLVSQFTLHASTKKGNRPSYIRASKPEIALPLYHSMIAQLQMELGKNIATGEFGADMKVELINDGPVTIWMDSKNKE